jgi:[lysine-biosynthesis-protein LysW]--L-2-aminoadipate ligase
MLLDSAKKRGVDLGRLADGEALLSITERRAREYDAVLQRSVSYSRSQAITAYLESAGTLVVNSHEAARVCADKMLTSMELAAAGVPTPETHVAFTPETARRAAERLGFPLVMKPVMGSWARMVHRINDRDALEAQLEALEEMGSPWQKIYYLQRHIEKPGRDMRAFVVGGEVIAAIYRHSTEKSGWLTNTSRGGTASNCPVTPELRELSLRAVSFLPEGIYGVDLMESKDGMVVHEVNHTTEFRNSSPVTGVDIGDRMVEYFISRAKR